MDPNSADDRSADPPPKRRRTVLRNVTKIEVGEGLCKEVIERAKGDASGRDMVVEAEVISRLSKVAAKWVHKGKAELYGSRITGAGVNRDSDFDVSVGWPGYKPVGEGTAEKEAYKKKLVKLCKTLHAKGFLHGKVIPSKRIVLVSCTDSVTGQTVDITLNNTHGVANSHLFKVIHYTLLPELNPAVWVIKSVGALRGFVNPKKGFLSSYCVLTMFVIAAQKCGLIPAKLDLDAIRRTETPAVPPAPSPQKLALLLATFLATYHTSSALSLSVDTMPPAPAPTDTNVPLYVSDILDGSNCARSLTPSNWLVLVEELGRIVDLAANGDSLERWLVPPDSEDRGPESVSQNE
eukprot:TRINITY_DN47674_c0_g1_i1.p1 TRINITY_DN47674_c0_g1~~TRINITY_DN47674_c0_g1_i1.p1  ORF type:complete len:350 (+),score=62.93 TRINITY_DN47674_c0_g1_i1:49-1098(+)